MLHGETRGDGVGRRDREVLQPPPPGLPPPQGRPRHPHINSRHQHEKTNGRSAATPVRAKDRDGSSRFGCRPCDVHSYPTEVVHACPLGRTKQRHTSTKRASTESRPHKWAWKWSG